MSVTKSFDQLPKESLRFNRLLQLGKVDLSETATGTAMEFHAVIPAGARLNDILLVVGTAPQDFSDAAFDDIQITIGDSSSATLFMAAQQIAALAGSPVNFAAGKAKAIVSTADATTNGGTYVQADVNSIVTLVNALKAAYNLAAGKLYTSADYLKVVITPESGKALNDLDVADIRIYADITFKDHIG